MEFDNRSCCTLKLLNFKDRVYIVFVLMYYKSMAVESGLWSVSAMVGGFHTANKTVFTNMKRKLKYVNVRRVKQSWVIGSKTNIFCTNSVILSSMLRQSFQNTSTEVEIPLVTKHFFCHNCVTTLHVCFLTMI